jgi:hypothetical protein
MWVSLADLNFAKVMPLAQDSFQAQEQILTKAKDYSISK